MRSALHFPLVKISDVLDVKKHHTIPPLSSENLTPPARTNVPSSVFQQVTLLAHKMLLIMAFPLLFSCFQPHITDVIY